MQRQPPVVGVGARYSLAIWHTSLHKRKLLQACLSQACLLQACSVTGTLLQAPWWQACFVAGTQMQVVKDL